MDDARRTPMRGPFGRATLAAACALVAVASGCAGGASVRPSPATAWNPRAYADENTIELRVMRPGSGEHWFKVWVAVLDDQIYVRLGSASAKKLASNETAPLIGVRIAGQQFDRVRTESVPDKAESVAAAMAAKYWSDVFVRHVSHPLTLRLTAE